MRTLDISDLGADQGYADVLALQNRAHARRVAGEGGDCLFLLEHRSVYTLGNSADASHILYSEGVLQEAGIERVTTSRGGDVTYHGPGQLVGYPVVHLRRRGILVLEYLRMLEETLIRTLAAFGIAGNRDARNRGVWVGDAKIAAIGIRVSRGVATHGFALNVDPDMSHFSGIIPCGLADAGVTSMRLQLGRAVEMEAVKAEYARVFKEIF